MSCSATARGFGRSATTLLIVCSTLSCNEQPAPPPATLVVVGTEYAFEAPAEIASGVVTLHLENEGRTELHNAAVIELSEPHTPADFVEAAAGDTTSAPWAIQVGGVESIPPGTEAEVILNLRPGPHLIVCFHQLRAAGQSRGQPHYELGMIAPLLVTAERSDAPPPHEDATLTLFDYGFSLSTPLHRGPQLLHVVGAGPQNHNVLVWRLEDGRTEADLLAWLESDQSSPPPAQALGGMSSLSPGRHAYLPLDLSPGSYVLVCLVPDEADSRSHASHGMVLEFSVA